MCEFTFRNETRGEQYKNRSNPYLYRNIDRGTTRHMLNVLATIIRLNGWSTTDYITWECCCEKYFYKDGEIVHYYQPCEYKKDDCYEAACPVCKEEHAQPINRTVLRGFRWHPTEWLAQQLYKIKGLSR